MTLFKRDYQSIKSLISLPFFFFLIRFNSKICEYFVQGFEKTMLKAIQILGSSSVFVSQRWKYHNSCGFSIISCSCSSSRTPTMTSLVMPTSPTRKMRCFRAFRASTIRAESNPDAPSSSSASSSASVQSTVSFSVRS